jgi:type IV secretory pathway TraG/TraD family ATPase VirD4
VGGQVLAHRFRMMAQNWRIIGVIGKFSWLISFVCYVFHKWNFHQIWNYFCCVKAIYRENMTTLPTTLFNSSWLLNDLGQWRKVLDNFIINCPALMQFKLAFEKTLFLGLKISIAVSIFSMCIMIFINKKLGKSLTEEKELLSGHDYVDAKTLKKAIKAKSDITLATIPYPKNAEARHTIITGTTGSGKTNIMIELIDQIRAKNEKAIVVDTVGTFVEKYYREGDIILNPLDTRSVSWSFLDECKNDFSGDILLKNTAACLLDRGNIHDKFWEEAAQVVFVETAKKIIAEKKSTDEFLNILLKVPLDEIQKYLKGTYAYSLMDQSADKMAISIRATLITAVSVFDILKESDNNFSIRNWINSDDKGILFLSCTPIQRSALIPLITTWISMAMESLMQLENLHLGSPTTEAIDVPILKYSTQSNSGSNVTFARLWFFIDELHNLKRLPKLETSLAEIRKFGGCFVMGTQMISQLNAIYGHEIARTITGLCGTKIVLNIPEPETAKYMSGFLGEKEEVSTSETISYGANTARDGVNISQQNAKKFSVPYSEIMNLKIGEAFIKFSGIDLIAKAQFELHEEKNFLQQLFSFEKKVESQPESKIISLQDYLKSYDVSENDIWLYQIPLNGIITSKPIYIFDENTTQIAKFLDDARAKNKKVVIFEDGSKFYDFCFQKDIDILLNPFKNGYSWDMLGEFEGDFAFFLKAIIQAANISEKNAEIYLSNILLNMEKMTPEITSSIVLQKLIFQPIKEVISDISEILCTENDIENYKIIRTKLALNLNFLKPIKDTNKEISVRDYTSNYGGQILFISCFNNKNAIRLSELIINSISSTNVLKIFSSKIAFPKSKNTIVDALDADIFNANGTVISSKSEILKRDELKTIFANFIRPQTDKNSFFIKTHVTL